MISQNYLFYSVANFIYWNISFKINCNFDSTKDNESTYVIDFGETVSNRKLQISIFGNELTKIGNTDNAMYSYGFNMKYAKSCSMKVQNFPQYIFVFPKILWKRGKKTCEIKYSRGCNNHRKPMWNYCVLGVITIYEIISCEMRYGIRQPMA